MIIITKSSMREPRSKRKFAAAVCQAVHLFLSEDKPISIEMREGISLRDAADALRNIAEILDTAGSVSSGDDDDDEEDDADWWKHQNDSI